MGTAISSTSLKPRKLLRVVCVLAAGALSAIALAGCGATKTTTVTRNGTAATPPETRSPGKTSSTASAPKPLASPEALARALLTPADIASLGLSLHTLKQTVQTSSNYTSPGAGPVATIKFVSGDPGCRSVLESHPVRSEAWAQVIMTQPNKEIPVAEAIESFKDVASAQRIEQLNRDQLANCHTFVGVNQIDQVRATFTHSALSVPPMGEDVVAHRLDGKATNGSYVVYDDVEIRSGPDVVFVSVSPSGRSTAETGTIVSAAVKKYSAPPK